MKTKLFSEFCPKLASIFFENNCSKNCQKLDKKLSISSILSEFFVKCDRDFSQSANKPEFFRQNRHKIGTNRLKSSVNFFATMSKNNLGKCLNHSKVNEKKLGLKTPVQN
jgi:hypothetical protein